MVPMAPSSTSTRSAATRRSVCSVCDTDIVMVQARSFFGLDESSCHRVPSPARGGGTGRGHATRFVRRSPLPHPPPQAGEGGEHGKRGARGLRRGTGTVLIRPPPPPPPPPRG